MPTEFLSTLLPVLPISITTTESDVLLDPVKKPILFKPPIAKKPDVYEFLNTHDTFSSLPESEIKKLAEVCRFATLVPGEYITIEGNRESLSGFIVVSGRLSMLKTSINGKELVVELLAPNDIFGLLVSLSLEKLPAQLSARAQTKSQVLWMPIINLLPLLSAHPILYREFVAYLLHTLQSSYRISRGLAHDRVEVRIAAILSSLAIKFARVLPAPQDHTIDITRQQIADLTGTTPESAIRVTRAMQRDGLIDIKRPGVVRVINLEALQTLAEEG
jgi:CRP-like cAMP-binding protein